MQKISLDTCTSFLSVVEKFVRRRKKHIQPIKRLIRMYIMSLFRVLQSDSECDSESESKSTDDTLTYSHTV